MKKFMFLLMLPAFMLGGQNFVKNTIKLDKLENQMDYKIELIFGKELEVDCNKHFLEGGKLKEKSSKEPIALYEFNDKAELASTMMMCPDNKKKKKFVHYSFTKVLDYDSYMPIVIKAPKDVIVKYKIYKKIDEKNAEVAN
ncbi:ecotin family protein [Campylobacter sp.]|uniref:ecotin family protein n=1 Tax=Campylobacter sp. TaxID=205 RepID=UPI002710EF5C|nr:ecotin family protein [Campylobacter sp.]